MPDATSTRPPVDRSGDPDELVGATEAARVLGLPRPDRLPRRLLDLADDITRHPDGAIQRRRFKRSTLWTFADTELTSGTTTINNREALDRRGIATRAGVSLSKVDAWIAGSPTNGFPSRIDHKWFDAEAIDQWLHQRATARRDALTPVTRSGDPDELVTKAEIARIVGYGNVNHLSNSPLLAALLERNNPADNDLLPSGRIRRRWPRRIVWEVAEARTNRRGRPAGRTLASRTVDRSGDPDELVEVSEAARVLGYPHPNLPTTVLDRADIPRAPGQRRRWKRRTLWSIADETTTPPTP